MTSMDALLYLKNYCKFVEKDSNVIDAPKGQLSNEERVFTIN